MISSTGDKEKPIFTRGRPSPLSVEPGEELHVFLSEVSAILRRDITEKDLDHKLREDLVCDDFDLVECIMAAEEVWGNKLFPHPASATDYNDTISRYMSLRSIVEDALSRS